MSNTTGLDLRTFSSLWELRSGCDGSLHRGQLAETVQKETKSHVARPTTRVMTNAASGWGFQWFEDAKQTLKTVEKSIDKAIGIPTENGIRLSN